MMMLSRSKGSCIKQQVSETLWITGYHQKAFVGAYFILECTSCHINIVTIEINGISSIYSPLYRGTQDSV